MALGNLGSESDLLNWLKRQFPILAAPQPTDLAALFLTLAVAGTERKVAFGKSSVTFTASANSALVTIPHGLGAVPTATVTMAATVANARCTIQEDAAPDATNIYLKGFESRGTAVSVSQDFYWLSVG